MTSSPALFEAKHAVFAPPIAGHTPATSSGTSTSGSHIVHPLILPSCYHRHDRTKGEKTLVQISGGISNTNDILKEYIRSDLDVSRLNEIHKHLWMAGLPFLPRPLHTQLVIGRNIIVSERADLHLLWYNQNLYLKPLPEYLLSYSTWSEILTLPSNKALYASASGLIYSYISLISSRSDLKIAHETCLLSRSITWEQWTSLTSSVLSTLSTAPPNKNSTPSTLNIRYIYGELRLARVNFIYRYIVPGSSLFQAYYQNYTDYKSFFNRNFAWVITVVVYVTVVLTAMQVGLGTTQLHDSQAFNRASFGFTVFAIIGPLAVVGTMLVFGLGLVIYHLRYALKKREVAVPFGVGKNTVAGGGGGGGNSTGVNTAGAGCGAGGGNGLTVVNGNTMQMQNLNGGTNVNGNVSGSGN